MLQKIQIIVATIWKMGRNFVVGLKKTADIFDFCFKNDISSKLWKLEIY